MLDMEIGQLKFKINGVDKGIASINSKLKSGEWFMTCSLWNECDMLRIVNPKKDK